MPEHVIPTAGPPPPPPVTGVSAKYVSTGVDLTSGELNTLKNDMATLGVADPEAVLEVYEKFKVVVDGVAFYWSYNVYNPDDYRIRVTNNLTNNQTTLEFGAPPNTNVGYFGADRGVNVVPNDYPPPGPA